MPLDGERLVVEPSYPNAAALMGIGAKGDDDVESIDHDDASIRNIFWSWRWRSEIVVWDEGGKVCWGKVPRAHNLGLALSTLGCSDVWGIEQERNAVNTLGTLLRHRQFKQYLLTGMFLERSARSGVSYLFRRLRPTVAITTRPDQKGHEGSRILCTLCLHPIAYYASSWAGAMTPTDDVLAHLMLMRGDEPMFWRRANQHAPFRPEAGL
jgi:hypothetical protein